MKKKSKASAVKSYIPLTPEQVLAVQTAWRKIVDEHLEAPFVCLEAAFEREAGAWYLRAYVDTPDKNISLDQCAMVTRQLDPFVETLPLPESCHYSLEVSSPGMFRMLKTEQDWTFYQGEPVQVKQADTVLGAGVFKHYDNTQQKITIQSQDNRLIEFSLTTPVQVHLNYPLKSLDEPTVLDSLTLEDAAHA